MDTTSNTTTTRIMVVGDTFAHRKHLKGLGLRWDAAKCGWVGTQDQLDRWANSVPAGCRVVPVPSANEPCPRCGTYCCGDCAAN